MQNIVYYRERFDAVGIVFCFDSWKSLRKEFYPQYKSNRRNRNPEESAEFEVVAEEIAKMRRNYLPSLGFRNVFVKTGYEADDLIAVCCDNVRANREYVIVSRDRDLYQLLGGNVIMVEPGKKEKDVTTPQSMYREYGVKPDEWVMVKAIAGDSSDNIPGIEGIGIKTACKYLQGKSTPRVNALVVQNRSIIGRNKKLMKLPWPGLGRLNLREDKVTRRRWESFAAMHGMDSLTKAWRR